MTATAPLRTDRNATARRSLGTGILCLVMTGVLVGLFALEFSRANDLIQNGKTTIATAMSDSQTVRGRKGRISYATSISLDGVQTTIGLNFGVRTGDRFRMIYSPSELTSWASQGKGWFYSYMVGGETMSPAALVEQKLGETYTIGRWIVAAFGIGGFYFLYDFFRVRHSLKNE
jgi:hypothetical protein